MRRIIRSAYLGQELGDTSSLENPVARGEARPDSDVDLLVELEPGRSLLDRGGLLMDLQAMLGREVDVVTPNGLRDRIRERVLREALPL